VEVGSEANRPLAYPGVLTMSDTVSRAIRKQDRRGASGSALEGRLSALLLVKTPTPQSRARGDLEVVPRLVQLQDLRNYVMGVVGSTGADRDFPAADFVDIHNGLGRQKTADGSFLAVG